MPGPFINPSLPFLERSTVRRIRTLSSHPNTCSRGNLPTRPSTPYKRKRSQSIGTHADIHNLTHTFTNSHCAQICCSVLISPMHTHKHITTYICKPHSLTHLQIHTQRRHTPQLGLTLLAGLNCFVVFLGLLFLGLSWQATRRVYKPPPLQQGTTENTQWKHLCPTLQKKQPASIFNPLRVSKSFRDF